MSRKSQFSFILGLALLMLASMTYNGAYAQGEPTPTNTPRPTPTNMAPVSDAEPISRGSIRGLVYTDANGDGKCVNTGLVGEAPAAGVTLEFVSSDEKTIITHVSAENGGYELAAAGESYWRVTAQPPAGWVVTSPNPLYVPIYPDTPLALDVNFCVQKLTAVPAPLPLPAVPGTTTLLPESGASANTGSLWLAFGGLTFVLVGLGLYWREKRPSLK